MKMTLEIFKILKPWLWRTYIVWSICADILVISGIVWLLL